MAKKQTKMRRKAWEKWEEEEEKNEGYPQAGSHHRVEAAFHCRTRENISVEQRAWQELHLYYIPEREGIFHRGSGLNLTSGQYTAPMAGYYTFTVTLHIAIWRLSQLERGSDVFTVSVTRVLYLQAGQYASVFVDNPSGSPLTLQSGSDFSAVLLGV